MRRSGYAQAHRAILGPILSELTGLQAKLLLAVLLEANPMTARYDMSAHEVAEIAGIPRQKVYAALRALESRGLLSYEPGSNQHSRTTVDISALLGRGSAGHDTEQADSPAGHDTEQATPSKGDNQGDKHATPEQPKGDPKALEPKTSDSQEKRTTPRNDDSKPSRALGSFPDCMGEDSWRGEGTGEFRSSHGHILKAIKTKHGMRVNQADLEALGDSIKACCPHGCMKMTADICASVAIDKVGRAANLRLAGEWYRKDRGPLDEVLEYGRGVVR